VRANELHRMMNRGFLQHSLHVRKLAAQAMSRRRKAAQAISISAQTAAAMPAAGPAAKWPPRISAGW